MSTVVCSGGDFSFSVHSAFVFFFIQYWKGRITRSTFLFFARKCIEYEYNNIVY